MWFVFALLSMVFAALTSILAKVGIYGVNSNLATVIRTLTKGKIDVVLDTDAFNEIDDLKLYV